MPHISLKSIVKESWLKPNNSVSSLTYLKNRQTNFNNLPASPIFGFVILKDGSFVIVDRAGGHNKALGGSETEFDEVDRVYDEGGIRVGYFKWGNNEANLDGTGKRRFITSHAKKTLKDLADYYKLDYELTLY